MKHIRVTGGPRSGRSLFARELMFLYAADGLDVALVDHDAMTTRNDGCLSRCDLLITVHAGPQVAPEAEFVQ